jgi:prolyl-tRNA synthetase
VTAAFLDADGNDPIMEMGTDGIGITRTMAAAVEQNHDENGIVWPMALAPYEVVIVPVKWNDDASRAVAETLYDDLRRAGVDVVLDDRDDRAGVKFADADLIGYPLRVTIGPRGIAAGTVELKRRNESEARELAIQDAASAVAAAVSEARAA